MTNEWLKQLKPGDEVGVLGDYGKQWIGKVKKITATGKIRLEDGTLYNTDGWQATSDTWHRNNLSEVTQKMRDEVEKTKLIYRIRNLELGKLTLDQLRRIDAIIREPIA